MSGDGLGGRRLMGLCSVRSWARCRRKEERHESTSFGFQITRLRIKLPYTKDDARRISCDLESSRLLRTQLLPWAHDLVFSIVAASLPSSSPASASCLSIARVPRPESSPRARSLRQQLHRSPRYRTIWSRGATSCHLTRPP